MYIHCNTHIHVYTYTHTYEHRYSSCTLKCKMFMLIIKSLVMKLQNVIT